GEQSQPQKAPSGAVSLASEGDAMPKRILSLIESNTLSAVAEESKDGSAQKKVFRFAVPPPQPRIPYTIGENLTLMVIDDLEIARQLTIETFDLFTAIQTSELFNLNW